MAVLPVDTLQTYRWKDGVRYSSTTQVSNIHCMPAQSTGTNNDRLGRAIVCMKVNWLAIGSNCLLDKAARLQRCNGLQHCVSKTSHL